MRGRLRPKLANIPGLRVSLSVPQAIRVGGRMSKSAYDYTLYGPDTQQLYTEAPKLERVVARMARISSELGREVATPEDTRRILGLAHNIDFEWIEDPKLRAVCEARSLRLARAMLLDTASFPTIGAVTKAAQGLRDWQPDIGS